MAVFSSIIYCYHDNVVLIETFFIDGDFNIVLDASPANSQK